MSIELYAEFFLRFFIIMILILSALLSLASLLKMKHKNYLFKLLLFGFLSFTVLWSIYQFCEIVAITLRSVGSDLNIELVSKTFALMASTFILSISIIKRKLRRM